MLMFPCLYSNRAWPVMPVQLYCIVCVHDGL